MKVIAYARYSSNGQDISSIERQHNAAKAFAARKGWTVNEWPADEARSAYHGHNMTFGKFGKLFKRVVSGEIGRGDVIIVEAIDRLSRKKVLSALGNFLTLMGAGVTVVTTMDGQELNEENYEERWPDLVSLIAKMAQANQDSEVKHSRGMSAWNDRREAGVLTLMNPAWLDKAGKPIEDRVALVREAFALADEGFGSASIAKKFNARPDCRSWGAESRSGDWSSSYISKMLRNRAVIGECQPRTGPKSEPFGPAAPNYFERVVDQVVFDRVTAKISKRKFAGSGSGRKGAEFANLFRSMMVCEKCERSMIMLHTGKYPYLKCSGGRSGSCDHVRGYHYVTLEQAFLKAVVELKIDTGRQPADFEIKSEIASLKNDLATLDRNITFIIDKMFQPDAEGNLIESPALNARLASFEAEKIEKAAALKTAETRLILEGSPLDQTHAQIAELWSQLYAEDGDKTMLRMRIHDKPAALIKTMAMTQTGNLWFILRDGTFYFMARSRPEGLRIKGKFPLDRYLWHCERMDIEENDAATARIAAGEALPLAA